MGAHILGSELESTCVYEIHGSHSSILARTLQQLISPEGFCGAQKHQLAPVATKWWKRKAILRSTSSPVQPTQTKYREGCGEGELCQTLKGMKLFSLHGDLSLSHLGSDHINPEEHGYKFSPVLFQHQHCICQKILQ